MQAIAPELGVYSPGAHERHRDLLDKYVPNGQVEQNFPSSVYAPTGHIIHTVAPAVGV